MNEPLQTQVDTAADPSAPGGLVEAVEETAAADAFEHALAGLTVEQLQERRPELVQEILAEPYGELRRLQAELAQLREAEAGRQRQEQITRLLSEHQLPDPASGGEWARAVVGPGFLAQLRAAPDEPTLRELVEERARLVRLLAGEGNRKALGGSPLAREPGQGVGDGKEEATEP